MHSLILDYGKGLLKKKYLSIIEHNFFLVVGP